jgi:[lysine-biosynthesis-protein LysW]---L-2-aminoadipate ligase
MVKLCIIYDKVRFEEKELYDKARMRGLKTQIIDAKSINIGTNSKKNDLELGDIVLQRSISHYRGLYLTACLEFLGFLVINSFKVGEICGNKLLTSIMLAKQNIPTPTTHFAFSSESLLNLINKTGFPLVVKPIVGSWGRGVFALRDNEAANMIVELREEDDNPLSRIYYIQEMVKRPPRDLRCIVVGDRVVAAVYRYSANKEWRTNIARGGRTEEASITKELEDITLKAARVVGGGVLGVDLMEDDTRGLLVHEINNTVEFHGASKVAKTDIASAIIDYSIETARN